jgi:hypothetical protein
MPKIFLAEIHSKSVDPGYFPTPIDRNKLKIRLFQSRLFSFYALLIAYTYTDSDSNSQTGKWELLASKGNFQGGVLYMNELLSIKKLHW